MREIKFRRAYFNYEDDSFAGFMMWGPTEHGFSAPGSMSNACGKVDQQFTCLKDCEGVEVYEGDILTHPEFRTNVVVEWKHGCWHLSGWDVIRTPITPGKVIGNIYENPDLLTS